MLELDVGKALLIRVEVLEDEVLEDEVEEGGTKVFVGEAGQRISIVWYITTLGIPSCTTMEMNVSSLFFPKLLSPTFVTCNICAWSGFTSKENIKA